MKFTLTIPGSYGVYNVTEEIEITEAGQVTAWIGLHGHLAVQVSGDADAIELQVERSTRRPNVGVIPNTAPAADPIKGNPSAGIQTQPYVEPGIAWWRVRCVSIGGGSAIVAINGLGF